MPLINVGDRLVILRPNWPAKVEAQPVLIRYRDCAVTVFINESHELCVEIGGEFRMDVNQGTAREVTITLPNDT